MKAAPPRAPPPYSVFKQQHTVISSESDSDDDTFDDDEHDAGYLGDEGISPEVSSDDSDDDRRRSIYPNTPPKIDTRKVKQAMASNKASTSNSTSPNTSSPVSPQGSSHSLLSTSPPMGLDGSRAKPLGARPLPGAEAQTIAPAERILSKHESKADPDMKVGGKLVEYTKQQNELKYGKLIPIVAGVEAVDLNSPKIQSKKEDPAEPDLKIVPSFIEYTQQQNRDKYRSMIPIKPDHHDIEAITDVKITGYDKRYNPEKYYVYNIEICRGTKVSFIFRRYSQFHTLFTTLTRDFPNTPHPPFPPKIYFGRSHIKSVSKNRMKKLNEYLRAILQLKETFLASPTFVEFFRATMEDIESEAFNSRLKNMGINFDD